MIIEFLFYFLDENVVILVKQRLKFLMNIFIHIYQIHIQVKKQKKNLLENAVLVYHKLVIGLVINVFDIRKILVKLKKKLIYMHRN